MPGPEHGFIRAIETLITGIIISVVIRAFIDALDLGILGIIISILIFGVSIFSIITLSGKMKYWAFGYTVGWFIGLGIMIYALSSLLNPFEVAAYIVITIFTLVLKISNKI